ncbi:hypothetical protein BDV18DRAFT_157623 [Aspergillus unguis]
MEHLAMDASGKAQAPAGPLKEGPSGPVDIPFEAHGASYALIDKKAPQILEAENEKLDELIEKFTKGFDPGAFGGTIIASIPMLTRNLFPGSYAHLLLLLLESFEMVQATQLSLEGWLAEHFHGNPIIHPTEISITDETFFGAEIEMLTKLLQPIREGTRNSIYWVNTRRMHPTRTCEELEASIRVIESFKNDVCEALKDDHELRTFYTHLPISVERTAMFSMKQLRLDACKATLHWDNYNGTEIEFTSFFRFYKAHISETEPEKARATGWLPPTSPGTPRLSAEEADEGDLASWISHGVNNEIIDLLLKTALWLSLARGLAAAHLFCDVARLFVLNEPNKAMTDEYGRFLLKLIRLRTATDGVQFSPTAPVPREPKTLPSRNVDYFQDVWRTGHRLSTGLYDNISFLAKNNASTFKLADPPRRRSGHEEMKIIAQTSFQGEIAATECLTGNANSSDEESLPKDGSLANDTAEEYECFELSPDKPAIFNNKTSI